MSKRDRIENLIGMIDDDIICEYLSVANKRRHVRSVRVAVIAAVCAVLLAIPTAIGIMNRGEDPVVPVETSHDTVTEAPVTDDGPVEPEGKFAVLSVWASKTDDRGFIAGDTSFMIKTENGSVDRVRRGIYIEPALEYSVRETDEEECFEIIPEEPIPDNTVVKLSEVEDKIIINSWAFQTHEILSISGTFPASGSMNNDVHTTLEIEFSYASVENVEEHVTIEPEISGSWAHFGKTWRFTPDSTLANETTYTVTVSPGITAEDEVIEDEYVFSFGTYPKDPADSLKFIPKLTTVDNINTYRPGEKISMMFVISTDSGGLNSVLPEDVSGLIKSVSLEKFNSADEFIRAAAGDIAYQTVPAGEYGYTLDTIGTDYNEMFILSLDTSPEEGYYRAVIRNHSDNIYAQWFIQIHPISAYALTTAYDLIVWTADENGIAADVPVSLRGNEYVTDKDGILKLDISDNPTSRDEYMYIGDSEFPLIVGMDSVNCTYPKAYIYADKLKYRTNDTINIWGYVPSDTVPETSEGKFELAIGEYANIPVELDENGTFSASYKLENFDTVYLQMYLRLDGRVIASRYADIADYEDENYSYELNLEKNYIHEGESLKLSVKVTHISGISVAGKSIKVSAFNRDMYASTDKNGVAHFEISSEDFVPDSWNDTEYSPSISDEVVSVYNGTAEEASPEYLDSKWCYIIRESEILHDSVDGDKITLNANKTKTPEDGWADNEYEFLGDPLETELQVFVYEKFDRRYIKGYTYDPYTKKNVPEYAYESDYTVIDSYTVTTVGGSHTVDLSKYELKNSYTTIEEDVDYYYYTQSFIVIGEEEYLYLNSGSYHSPDINDVDTDEDNGISNENKDPGSFSQYDVNTLFGYGPSDAYTSYKYRLNADKSKSADGSGDKIDLSFEGYKNAPTDTGKVMRILFKNDLVSTATFDPDDDMSFILEEDIFPNVIVTGVYYRDGEFYRMPQQNVGIGADDRSITFDVKTDREVYSPGDTVTVDITATNEDGSAVADAAVNISVMNCAGGELPPYGISSTVKAHYLYDSYSYSSHRDYDIYTSIGGWGDGGGYRSIFLDSPYFGNTVTDENGKATVTFTLPDNITEYGITVHGANGDWYTGSSRTNFKVSKDFFIQHIVPKDVKATDDFVINGICNSDTIDNISAVVSIKETGQSASLSGTTGQAFEVNFGKLPVGTYTVTITAEAGKKYDAVEYPVTVIESGQRFKVTSKVELDREIVLHPVANPVEIQVTTDSYDRYMNYLSFLANNVTDRYDTQLADFEGKQIRFELTENKAKPSYVPYGTGDSDRLIRPLENAEGDPVLTALAVMLSEQYKYNRDNLSEIGVAAPVSLTNAAEKLFLHAACDKPVLRDLRYMADSIEDDDYIEIVLALGFIASGDYSSAREMYLRSENDPGNEGYTSLRAVVASFVHKEDAADIIDRLIAEEPSEYYLGLAVVAYMQNRCGLTEDVQSLTVTCGDYTEEVSVAGLETKQITIVTETLEDVVIVPQTDRICANYTCTSGLEHVEGAEKAITADLKKMASEDASLGLMKLTVDLSMLDSVEGTLHIVLPDSLKLEDIPKLPYGYSMKTDTNKIEIHKMRRDVSEKVSTDTPYSSTVEIPLIARSSGNFEFESVVFVSNDGTVYTSEGFMFDLIG